METGNDEEGVEAKEPHRASGKLSPLPRLLLVTGYNCWNPAMLAEVKNMDMEWAISVGMGRIEPKFGVKIEQKRRHIDPQKV